eukprot:TRINITY_DN18912_c0_g1_i1.p2 TRINITY_DN18912_c0_g1~~TRINITY_DN18912_c0_g1_i1.p2  ORF type:complete len:130 (-),score=22.18 TRINITY_DN18912_c0_g1_i1:7-396(-)
MNAMRQALGNVADFITVYIAEAHASDEWPLGQTSFPQPRTLEERRMRAQQFLQATGYEIPLFVDGIDNAFESAYAAHPERFFVIQRGVLVHIAEPGPEGYKVAALRNLLEEYVSSPSSHQSPPLRRAHG